MDLPHYSFDENDLVRLSKSLGIIELAIFGSVLRDDFNEQSDIDILVEFDENLQYSYFDLQDVQESFEDFFNRPIDLVEKKALRNPYRKETILKTARIIYAA